MSEEAAEGLTASLDLAAERGGDIAPLVYGRLFSRHPEMEALFVRDTDGSVRGQMLAQAIEALLDLTGRRYFAIGLIQTEIVNHENLGVPMDVFPAFFGVVRETVRDLCGDGWTAAMEAAWDTVLTDAAGLIA